MTEPTQGIKREVDSDVDVANKMPKLNDERTSTDCEVEGDLQFVYDELEIHPKSQKQLRQYGINSITDIIANQENFKDVNVSGVRENVQLLLYNFCLWYEDFHDSTGSKSWRQVFSWDVLKAFEEKLKSKKVDVPQGANESADGRSKMEALFDHAVDSIHDGEIADLVKLDEQEISEFYNHVVNTVWDKIPKSLAQVCQFDVKNLIRQCSIAIFNLPTGDPYPKIKLVAGRTQSGKSHVKAIVQATCDILQCPLIIITKGVAESRDLAKKLEGLLCSDHNKLQRWLLGVNKRKKSNVFADTAARISGSATTIVKELRDMKPKGKFVVIVDECDAMYRTQERSQRLEQAFDDLMDLNPALRLEISATPIPALLYIGSELGRQVEMLELGTSEDYFGVTQMKPFIDVNGKDQYLHVSSAEEKKEFKLGEPYKRKPKLGYKLHDNEVLFKAEEMKDRPFEFQAKDFSKSERLSRIPYTDETVMDLYEDALKAGGADDPNRRGTLLLDCTINRVWADENIFQKAACVQNHFHRLGKKMVAICVIGNGIYFRRPGFSHGRKVSNQKTVSEVLQRLDEEFGLSMPFFVFGFSKMRRCISYRSDARVPTHMVLNLGLGQSNESFIQAIGRATFNGLETVLKNNGYDTVTVLAPKRDLQMAQRYTNFVHEVSVKLRCGDATTESVMKDGENRFTDSSNYMRFSNRKTGQMKGLDVHLPEQDSHFEDPDDVSLDSVEVADSIVRRVKLSVFYLVTETELESASSEDEDADVQTATNDEKRWKTVNATGFTIQQIQNKYNDTFQENGHSIKKGELTKILNQLRTESRLERINTGRWKARNWAELKNDCLRTVGEHPGDKSLE